MSLRRKLSGQAAMEYLVAFAILASLLMLTGGDVIAALMLAVRMSYQSFSHSVSLP